MLSQMSLLMFGYFVSCKNSNSYLASLIRICFYACAFLCSLVTDSSWELSPGGVGWTLWTRAFRASHFGGPHSKVGSGRGRERGLRVTSPSITWKNSSPLPELSLLLQNQDCMELLSISTTVFPTVFWAAFASIYLTYSSVLLSCTLQHFWSTCYTLFSVDSPWVDENVDDCAQLTILMSFLMNYFKE